MAKYAFFNFPTYGQVNPTLAIVQELVARGEEVVYFNAEPFRMSIEAAGARFQPYDAAVFKNQRSPGRRAVDDNRRLALLSVRMIRASRRVVPPLLARVKAERPDCLVYSDMFLWARIIAHTLRIPAAALRPTYAADERFRKSMLEGTGISASPAERPPRWLEDELTELRRTYALPFADLASLRRVEELGLGVALDESAVTANALNAAVARVIRRPGFKSNVQAMQRLVRDAGGYHKAADALQVHARSAGR